MKALEVILILIMILLGSHSSYAQAMFGTSHAVVDVSIHYEDSLSKLQSKDVKLALNYETAEFVMHLNTEDLSVPADSAFDLTDLIGDEDISYKGKFDLAYIKTKEHPPMSFEVVGDLRIGDSDPVRLIGVGDLVHVSDGAYPCQLYMLFRTRASDLMSIVDKPLQFEYILIEIQQVLLEEDFE